jgi:hypothetical protein
MILHNKYLFTILVTFHLKVIEISKCPFTAYYGLCGLKKPHLWHENCQIPQVVHEYGSNYV